MILVRILHRLLSKYLTTTLSTFMHSIHYMAAYFCCDEFEKSYMHDKLVFLKKRHLQSRQTKNTVPLLCKYLLAT